MVKTSTFDAQASYSHTQLAHFYKCAERVIRTLGTQKSLSLPEGYTTEQVSAQVKAFSVIVDRYEASSKVYSRLQDASHRVGMMIVEAFLELRGRPKCESSLLRQYLARPEKASEALHAALTELKTTPYWRTSCSIEFKQSIETALVKPDKLQELKAQIDSIAQQELEDTLKKAKTWEEDNLHFLVQNTLGERMVSSSVIRRVITLLANIPFQCFAMNNHLFGTSISLIQQNPDNHFDVRDRDLFKLVQTIEAEQGLSSVTMRFNPKNSRAQLVLCGHDNFEKALDIWIINPDGRPFPPSPLNGVQVILGPEATIPLAIEEGKKSQTVSYNFCTGFTRTAYQDAKKLRSLHIQSVDYSARKAITDRTINQTMHQAPQKMRDRFVSLGGTPMLLAPPLNQAQQNPRPTGTEPSNRTPGQPSLSSHPQYSAQTSTASPKKLDVRPKNTQANQVLMASAASSNATPPNAESKTSGEGRKSKVFSLFSGLKAFGRRK
ncbi:hypothetical protein GV64_11450 [Endozoicomonas elysicola]|uniref:Uncharacterized protein n=1 Tax=Endozoicomonas elysicola TaxID=305900 RepID=A0A081KAU9_9GAMM|nr:hypothetical protein GV64_11450 [Endozoicomonas elysicola]